MDLSIIIVSWRVKEKLRANLAALFQSETSFKYEVIVIDNDSGDGSVEMVRAEFSSVRLIVNSANLGFAKANNQAIKQAAGKFILLLNPDMLVEAGTIEKMFIWALANPQATVSGCKLLSTDGKIVAQVRRFPRLFDQLMIIGKLPHIFPGAVKKYLCAGFDYDKAARVDSIRGAFFLINTDSYHKIGGAGQPLLDERYFIWFEEVDFCRQIYKLGGEVWYTPAAVCHDEVGASFRQVELSVKQGYFRASMLAYFQKWEPRWQAAILEAAWRLVGVFIK